MTHPACEKPDPGESAPSHEAYVAQVAAGDVRQVLEEQRLQVLEEFGGLKAEDGACAYAPGKWTVAQLAGHLADAEQILLERALRAARGDGQALPGFDEDRYAAAWRPRLDLELDRWQEQRRLALLFYAGLDEEAWLRPGRVEDRPHTARSLAWMMAGHVEHHLGVFRRRYRPQLPAAAPRRLEIAEADGLVMRQAELEDLKEIHALSLAERERLRPWLAFADGDMAPGDTWRFLLSAKELWLRRGMPTLVLRTPEGLAGLCGLAPVDAGTAHIGYWLSASAEGRGLARAAVRWLTRHAFDTLGLDRVEIRCATDNRRSRALPEALGYHLEGIRRRAQRLAGGSRDLAVHVLTSADWPTLSSAWASAGDRAPAPPVESCRVLRLSEAGLVMEQTGVSGRRLGQDASRRFVRVTLEAGAHLPSHPVPDRAMFWLAAGSGEIQVDGVRHAVTTGDAVLVEAGAQRGWSAGAGGLELHVVRGWPEA